MFDELTRYLLEHKKLAIPHVGVFEVIAREANTDFAANIILPPEWGIHFSEDRNPADALYQEDLYSWLSSARGISKEEARSSFETFAAELETSLINGETVVWNGLGRLSGQGNAVVFTPQQEKLTPFTNVSAKKVIRENTSYATLVGDKETTTAEMREQLLLHNAPRKGRNLVLWIFTAVAAVAALWYFSQNGCNPSSAGNRQKVEAAKPGDTYRLQ